MGHLAILAQELGHQVSGSDQNVYPPMSDILAMHDVQVREDWDLAALPARPDLVVLGNAGMKRGHDAVEYILEQDLPFTSGAQWLGEVVLRDRWVLAVAGTHGKTTTASMLAWILDQAGLTPGFLIGGVPHDFEHSARLGRSPFFVVEADEYDTSYFDRRAKFLHYHPRTLIISNIEYDHADIFPDLAAIAEQFHLLLRRLPSNGLLLAGGSENIANVLRHGCWTPLEYICAAATGRKSLDAPVWHARGWVGGFDVLLDGRFLGTVSWSLQGEHNQANALAALAAARHVGVDPTIGIAALCRFSGVKRRLEKLGHWGQLTLYDDFAHHPTAIAATLSGLRQTVGSARIVALIDPASHTMKRGDLLAQMATCTAQAEQVVWVHNPDQQWCPQDLLRQAGKGVECSANLDALIARVAALRFGALPTHVVCMSNGSFHGLRERILAACEQTNGAASG